MKTTLPSAPTTDMNSYETNSSQLIASHDADMHSLRCFNISSSCSCGDLLKGVGSFGPEPNAPNTIDKCEGEGVNATSIVHYDESVNRIIVRATNGEIIAADNEVEVEITLLSANDTSKRSIPNKWSVAHIYYAPKVLIREESISWDFIKSFVVE